MMTEWVHRLRTRLAVALAASVVSADGPGQQRVHDVVLGHLLRIFVSVTLARALNSGLLRRFFDARFLPSSRS